MTKTLVAVCGRGCSGKDYFVDSVMGDPMFEGKIHRVVSSTTRPMREGETDGKEYHFVSPSVFLNQDLITRTTFKSNWRYGIVADEIIDGLNIAILNHQEIKQLEHSDIIIVPVFFNTSIMTILERTVNRNNGWEKWRRFFADLHDWKGFSDYICDTFRYRLILDGSHTAWYNKHILYDYLALNLGIL